MGPHRRFVAVALGALVLAGCSGSEPTADELAGVDSNGDGVRDDVAEHITTLDPELSSYLLEVAASEQQVVTLDPDSPTVAADAYSIATEANRFVTCTPEGVEPDAARDAASAVRDKVADTQERQERQKRFTALISGESFPEPECTDGPGNREGDPSAS